MATVLCFTMRDRLISYLELMPRLKDSEACWSYHNCRGYCLLIFLHRATDLWSWIRGLCSDCTCWDKEVLFRTVLVCPKGSSRCSRERSTLHSRQQLDSASSSSLRLLFSCLVRCGLLTPIEPALDLSSWSSVVWSRLAHQLDSPLSSGSHKWWWSSLDFHPSWSQGCS